MFEKYAYDTTEFVRSKCREDLDKILCAMELEEDSYSEEKVRNEILRFLKQKKVDIKYIDFSVDRFYITKPHNLYSAVCLYGQNPKYNKEEFEGKYKYKCKIGTYTFTEGEECSTRIFVNFCKPSENVIFKLMNQAFIF